jgi:hypothetical protein
MACATSVATRRSAACSSTSRWRSSRACVLDTAVAISSVKSASRRAVPAGSGRSSEASVIAPHSLPSTMMGPARPERIRSSRT